MGYVFFSTEISRPAQGSLQFPVKDDCEDIDSKNKIIDIFYYEIHNAAAAELLRDFSKDQLQKFPLYCGKNVSPKCWIIVGKYIAEFADQRRWMKTCQIIFIIYVSLISPTFLSLKFNGGSGCKTHKYSVLTYIIGQKMGLFNRAC